MNKRKLNRLKTRDEYRILMEDVYPDHCYDYWDYIFTGIDDDQLEYAYVRMEHDYYREVFSLPKQHHHKFPNFSIFVSRCLEKGVDYEELIHHPRVSTLLMIWLARNT